MDTPSLPTTDQATTALLVLGGIPDTTPIQLPPELGGLMVTTAGALKAMLWVIAYGDAA